MAIAASGRRLAQLGGLQAKPDRICRHDTWVGVIDRESRGYKNGVIVDILYKLTGIRYEPEGRLKVLVVREENSDGNREWIRQREPLRAVVAEDRLPVKWGILYDLLFVAAQCPNTQMPTEYCMYVMT